MLKCPGLLITLSAFAAVGFAAPAAAQKGAPSGANKCDKYKKGSDAWKKCANGLLEDTSDQSLFYAGYWLARTGQYAEALEYLNKAQVKDERILTYIGFATRKLGDQDTAMGFYARALTMNPNYTVARAYLGEAHLERGDVAKARDELSEIARRCGTTCGEYKELEAEIAKRS
jgi:tetratricopeptide (TPR) repeat protein